MKEQKKHSSRRLPARMLAISYLIVIMTMSLIFSSVFYMTSIHELDKRPFGDIQNSHLQDPDHELDEWIGRRSDESKMSLGIRLIILNVGTLLGGGVLSYWLARRTLRPIEKALDNQDRFIADASHELRTPITSALMSNEVALRNKKLTLQDAKSTIEVTVNDLKELTRLSNELLDDAREAQKEVKLSTSDIHEIVDDAIEKVQVIARKQNTTIKNETATTIIRTDVERLQKILVILIENAVKYSPPDSSVVVATRLTGSGTDVTVSDQGVGIDKTDIVNIFDRFYRADNSRSETIGYGLGLSIVKKILSEINATISVKSTIHRGSQFTVSLPNSMEKDS